MSGGADWKRGDVVTITDPAHPGASCILATTPGSNEPTSWFLVDETCATWRSTEWIEEREPVLLVREGAGADA